MELIKSHRFSDGGAEFEVTAMSSDSAINTEFQVRTGKLVAVK